MAPFLKRPTRLAVGCRSSFSCRRSSSSSSSSSSSAHRPIVLWTTVIAFLALFLCSTHSQTLVEARSTTADIAATTVVEPAATRTSTTRTISSTARLDEDDQEDDATGSKSRKTTTYYIWEEENKMIDDDNNIESDRCPPPTSTGVIPRMHGWKALIFGGSDETTNNNNKNPAAVLPPHPLRTNLWELHIQWRGPAKRSSTSQRSSPVDLLYSCNKLLLEFDPSGYVRVKRAATAVRPPAKTSHTDNSDPDDADKNNDDSSNPWIATGQWSTDGSPSGLSFSIPLPCLDDDDTSCALLLQHHFEADLHMNPFGRHAKLTRGIVVRDRRHGKTWFRPVVATFSGIGIGEDTVDLSYQKRQAPRQV